MDTKPNPIAAFKARHRQREDGWTPEAQEGFIIALIEHGSVRRAANAIDRHVTSAHRLRVAPPSLDRDAAHTPDNPVDLE